MIEQMITSSNQNWIDTQWKSGRLTILSAEQLLDMISL